MQTPLDFARLEPLITSRFPGSKPRIERIPAGLGDRRFYRVMLDAADPGAPSSLIARIEPQSHLLSVSLRRPCDEASRTEAGQTPAESAVLRSHTHALEGLIALQICQLL